MYLRSKAAVDPVKFTLSQKHQRKFAKDEHGTVVSSKLEEEAVVMACSLDDPTCELVVPDD